MAATSGCAAAPAPAPAPTPAPAVRVACDSVRTCQTACDAGDLTACYQVGRRLRRGVEVEGDPARARTVLERACQGGVLDACAELGALFRFGEGGERDVERARGLYERACDGGSLVGCTALGALLQAGISSLGKDPERAHALFRASCDGGEQSGCTLLALAIMRGEIDDGEPTALLDRACAAGEPEACAIRGELFLRGERRDAEAAVQHFRLGCDGGASAGCVALAYLHLEGNVLPSDPARAETLLRRACKLDGRSCGHLASRLVRRAEPDPAEAASLYERACAQWDGGRGVRVRRPPRASAHGEEGPRATGGRGPGHGAPVG